MFQLLKLSTLQELRRFLAEKKMKLNAYSYPLLTKHRVIQFRCEDSEGAIKHGRAHVLASRIDVYWSNEPHKMPNQPAAGQRP